MRLRGGNLDNFEYDVAFSFLARDEALASEMASGFRDRAGAFIYSERQKELAGSDGAERFAAVFGREARICVVLYRQGWGDTPWTGVEESAMKDRGLTHGWNFLLVISLDGKSPIWLPRTQLWLGWERFGIQTAIAVIERKIAEHGGELRELDAVAHAAQVGAARRREADRDAFLNSEAGVEAAHGELGRMFDYLETKVGAAMAQAPHLQMRFVRRPHDRVVALASPGCTVTFGWSQQWANVLQGSMLVIRRLAGFYALDHGREDFQVVESTRATFTLDDTGHPAWVEEDEPARFHSWRSLAERYLGRVIDHAEDEPRFNRQLDRDHGWG